MKCMHALSTKSCTTVAAIIIMTLQTVQPTHLYLLSRTLKFFNNLIIYQCACLVIINFAISLQCHKFSHTRTIMMLASA